MAGLSNGFSTYYLLLGTALARVIEYMGPGSKDAAKELLLDYLDRRDIRRRCQDLDIGMNAWTPAAAEQFFWERHDSVVHDIDWPNHRATRAGPVFVSVSAIGARVLAYGPRTVLKAETIQLHWGDILGILQSLALASPPCQPAAPTEAPLTSEPLTEASTEASTEEQTKSDETESKDVASGDAEPEHVKYGMPAPRSPEQKAIQAFVIDTYGLKWRAVTLHTIMGAAGKDAEFKRRVYPFPERSTWRRALGFKKN